MLVEPVFVAVWVLVLEVLELVVPDADDVKILDVVDENV